jgi:hypothetical protein
MAAAQGVALASDPALLTALRRLLAAPAPHAPLLREAGWLLCFVGEAGGGAVGGLVTGGLLPPLLGAVTRLVRDAVRRSPHVTRPWQRPRPPRPPRRAASGPVAGSS